MSDRIISQPSNAKYRDSWERIWGKQTQVRIKFTAATPCDCAGCKLSRSLSSAQPGEIVPLDAESADRLNRGLPLAECRKP